MDSINSDVYPFVLYACHPRGYPLGAFDRAVLQQGMRLLIDAADDPRVPAAHVISAALSSFPPGNIHIRCTPGQAASYGACGFSLISTDPHQPASQVPGRTGRATVMAECLTPADVTAADRSGYDAVIIKGAEAGGRTGTLNAFVFFQAACRLTNKPIIVSGGIGKYAAAGLHAAGAAGVVLDEQLWLLVDAPLSIKARRFLRRVTPQDTAVIVDGRHRRRYHRRIHAPAIDTLTAMAGRSEDCSAYIRDTTAASIEECEDPARLLPLGCDAVFASEFQRDYGSIKGAAAGIGRFLERTAARLNRALPLAADSPFCRDHGIARPLFQGPMGNITETPVFADAIAAAGGMPFLAVGTLPDRAAKEVITTCRSRRPGHTLGIGLMGMLGIMDTDGFAQTRTILDLGPDYVILGGGDIEYVKRLMAAGIKVYYHTPVVSLFETAVKAGIPRIILEGNEAGGHIGPHSSFILWQSVLYLAERRGWRDRPLNVVFAGGIASAEGMVLLSGMIAAADCPCMQCGVQAGTVFLATDELVQTGCLDERYRARVLAGQATVVVAGSIGRPQRMLPSPKTEAIVQWEQEGQRTGRDRAVMKREFEEQVNRGALRMAARSEVFDLRSLDDPAVPPFARCDDAERYEREAGFLCGEAACLVDRPLTVAAVFEELFDRSAALLKQRFGTAGIPPEDESRTDNDIVIVGIGSRFPESRSTDEYWAHILAGTSCIREVPAERWAIRDYWDADRTMPNKTYSQIGGFADASDFNPINFGILPRSAKDIPPVQRLALMAAREAIQSAGLDNSAIDRERIGVFMGTSITAGTIHDFSIQADRDRLVRHLAEQDGMRGITPADAEQIIHGFRDAITVDAHAMNEDSNPAMLSNIVSARIAHAFNLRGPNYTADAACASAMAGLLNAVRALQSGQVDVALAGGADASNDPVTYISFAKVGALSAHMSCPFDAAADGFVMGEGAGVLVLKRRADAERDHDLIYARIRGIGSSSDGSGKGITAPNPEGQVRALRAAYADAGIDPVTVGLFEAHGTSTPTGDAAEFTAISLFFREYTDDCGLIPIGSVKSQIGHAKAAAGIAGLIKAVLSLHHRVLPATINVENVNPKLGADASPFVINTALKPWNAGPAPRRAACSSMGFGGTNFHVVLEEWPQPAAVNAADGLTDSGVLVFEPAADGTVPERLRKQLQNQPQLRAAAAALLRDRATTRGCRALAYTSVDEGIHGVKMLKVSAAPAAEPGRVCFLFPGQGAQFAGMGLDLGLMFPAAAGLLDHADAITADMLGVPIRTVLAADGTDDSERLKNTLFCQPAVFTVSYICAVIARELGIQPAMGLGHSLGEVTALTCAGGLDFETGLRLVIQRAQAMAAVGEGSDPGTMAAIMADEARVRGILAEVDGYVVIANLNAPEQQVISGTTEAVAAAVRRCEAAGIRAVPLAVTAAFHSGLMDGACKQFAGALTAVDFRPLQFPVWSNVGAAEYPAHAFAEFCRTNLAAQVTSPVRFRDQLQRAWQQGCRVFLTCGPGRVLSGLVRKNLPAGALCLDMLTDRGASLYPFIADAVNSGFELPTLPVLRAVKAWHRPPADISTVRPAPRAVRFTEPTVGSTADGSFPAPEKLPAVKIEHNPLSPGGTSMVRDKDTYTDIERYIMSMNDPVLTHMLFSPDFRQFINREQAGIRMLVRQTLLELFNTGAQDNRGGEVRVELPAAARTGSRRPALPTAPEPSRPMDEVFNIPAIRERLDPEAAAARTVSPAAERFVPAAEPAPSAAASTAPDIRQTLMAIICEKTGYSPDMIEPDAGFEADLRIDSIKQTEILGMLAERLGMPYDAGLRTDGEQVTFNAIVKRTGEILKAGTVS